MHLVSLIHHVDIRYLPSSELKHIVIGVSNELQMRWLLLFERLIYCNSVQIILILLRQGCIRVDWMTQLCVLNH